MLFEMLGGHPGEVTLTENFAMLPTSAVSGFYFGHRDSQYFGVARIGRDQLDDYAPGVECRWNRLSAGCGPISTSHSARTKRHHDGSAVSPIAGTSVRASARAGSRD